MALVEIVDDKIVLTIPVDKVTSEIKTELEDLLNNYVIEVIPVRKLSAAQNGLIHVLLKQYGDELGWEMLDMKIYLKEQFALQYDIFNFETSKCDMQLANEFIAFIIEHAIDNEINLYIRNKKERQKRHILEIDSITQRYVIACLKKKMCAVCGRMHNEYNTVDLDHWKTVASTAGNYENDDGLQTPFISLCRIHHNEKHNIGVESFKEKYHIEGLWLNEKLVMELKEIYPNHFKAFRWEKL